MSITGTGAWDTVTWPWPQVKFLEYYTLGFALIDTHLWLYEMYCNTSDVWVATAVQDLGVYTNIEQIDVAESGNFYLLTVFGRPGGTITIDSYIRNPGTGTPLITQLPAAYIPKSITVCNYNGQFIIGGVLHGDSSKFGDAGLNTVMWSQIGRVEFRIDNDVTKTAGYMNMPWGEYKNGIVYKIKKLGNRVIVYGDGGVGFLNPISSPVSGYGFERAASAGVRSGWHIDGNDTVHVFIDTNYDLWSVSEDYKFEKLGYREFMKGLITVADTKVSYEPNSKRFYISNGVEGYVLTQQGLYSTNQFVTSIGNYRGQTLCGFFLTGNDSKYRLVSDTTDFKIRGMKTIEMMEVGCDSDGDVSVAVDYRYNKNDAFTRSGWKVTNARGGAAIIQTAPEFRLCLESDTYVGMNVDYINVSVKVVDKRMIRGLYAKDEG